MHFSRANSLSRVFVEKFSTYFSARDEFWDIREMRRKNSLNGDIMGQGNPHKIVTPNPARQNGDFGRNIAYFPLIFRLFSAYVTSSAVFPPTCFRILPIFRLTFCPYSAGPVLPGSIQWSPKF